MPFVPVEDAPVMAPPRPAGRFVPLDEADFEQFAQPDPIQRTPGLPVEEGTPTTSSSAFAPLEAQEAPRPALSERAKLGARVGFAESGMGLLARTPAGQTLKDLPAGLGLGTDVTGGLFRLFDVPTNAQETVALRQEFDNMPNAKNAAEFAATGVGILGGGMASPENFVPIGRGATLARSVGRTAGVTGGLNALVDIGRQELDIAQGIKTEFSIGELALNAGVGAIAGGLIHLSLEGLGRLSQRIREALASGKLTPAQAAELANLEQAAQLAAQRKAQAVEADATPTRFDEDPQATAALKDPLAQPESAKLADIGSESPPPKPTTQATTEVTTPVAPDAAPRAPEPSTPGTRSFGDPTFDRVPDRPASTPEEDLAAYLELDKVIKARTAEAMKLSGKERFNAIEDIEAEVSNMRESLKNRHFGGETPSEAILTGMREGKTPAQVQRPDEAPITPAPTESAAAPRAAETAAPIADEPTVPATAPAPKAASAVVAPGEAVVAPTAKPPETRGMGTQYHGAKEPITSLSEGYYNPANIYGGESTFYTTDALDVASGYGRKSPNATVYKVTENGPVNFYNMEEAKPTAHWDAFFKNEPQEGLVGVAVENATGKRGRANLREIMDEIRAESSNENVSMDEVQGIFGTITARLEQQGFGGMTHIGGLKTKTPPHNVKIYFRPKEQIALESAQARSASPEPVSSVAETAPTPKAAPTPKSAPKKDYTVKDWIADIDSGKKLEDLPNPSIRGMAELRLRDKKLKDLGSAGRINITPGTTTLGGALVGGAGGAGYGITQGDTPEERLQNAIKYGVAWAGIGAAGGLGSGKLAQARRLTHSQKVIRSAQELERMRTGAGSVDVPQRGASAGALKQIQAKALGTDGMPNWWIKMRSTPVMQAIREGIRNRSSRAKDVLVKTVKAGDTVADEENFYVAQRLFPGRARAQKEATDTLFKESEKAFKDAAKKAGIDPTVTAEQYADYMRAKHAPAYNRYVGEPGDTAPASGMTDAQAAAKIQEYKKAGLDKFFEDFAATDRNVVDATRKILENDIITPEHAAWLRKNAPDYVPLNRDIDLEDAVFNVGGTRGFTVKGSGIRKAVGSELPYADMRGNLQANLTDAIIRVEKNRVAQRVYRFFEKHPWPGVSLERPKVIGTRKIAGGHEIPLYGEVPEGTMVARFGGKPHYVRFRDPKLANAFGDFGMDRVGSVLRWIGTLTRAFSGLVTRLNPNFWLPNLVRDRFDAFTQHASMNDWRGAFAQISPVTRGGVAENMRGVMDNFLNIDSADAKLYRQMIDDGGTSGGYGLSSRQDILENITKMREQLNKGVLGRTDWLKFVDVINELSENSTRLGAYRRALQVGSTREQAALAARDISIDFDMKGTLTKELASLWAFLNPATQGPVNFLKAQIRNPKTAIGILSGIAGVSAALNKINNSIDEEWKQKPQFKHARETGFPILYGRDPVTGDIQYLTIPIAQSMRPFKAMIDLGLDVSSGEIEDVRQGMRDAAMVLFNENPTGASRPGLSQVTPTLGRPFVDIAENRDYADRPIYPDFFRGKPEIENKARMYASTPDTPIGKAAIQMSAIADAAFDMDVSPEHVQYVVESYLGGPGRTATQTVNLTGALMKGEAPAPRDIPIVSSFVREARGETSERATKEYKEAYEAFSKAATQDALVRGRALGMFNKVRDLPQERWIPTLIQQLEGGAGDRLEDGTIDRNFARSLANIVENELKGRTATDEVILKMGVGSGARANYFFGEINKRPPEQRAAYIVEQKRKGLITPDVEKQLIAMFRQQQK